MSRMKLVDLTLHLHHRTAGAYLVSLDGDREGAVWLPRRACECDGDDEENGPHEFQVEEGIATEKGLT